MRLIKQWRQVMLVSWIALLTSTACVPVDWSAEFCKDNGGEFESRPIAEEMSSGFCVFADGTECDSWAFYEGRCQPKRTADQQRLVPVQGGDGASAPVPPPTTLDGLIDQADLIVIGEVGPVLVYDTFYGYGPDGAELDSVDAAGNTLPGMPVTRFVVEVEQVLRDDGTLASGEPVVLVMAGEATAETKELTKEIDYPFSFTGDRHLFLLTENPDGEGYGFYYGPWSRLLIDGETLRISNGSQDLLLFYDEASSREQPVTLEMLVERVADDTVDAAQLADAPLECPLAELIEFEIEEGSGYPTPQEALDSYLNKLPRTEYPPGKIAAKVKEEDRVVWAYVRDGEKVGSTSAHHMLWGLWHVMGVERCVDESKLPPVAPTRP